MHLAESPVGASDGADSLRTDDELEGAGVGEGQIGTDAGGHQGKGGRDREDPEGDRGERG